MNSWGNEYYNELAYRIDYSSDTFTPKKLMGFLSHIRIAIKP